MLMEHDFLVHSTRNFSEKKETSVLKCTPVFLVGSFSDWTFVLHFSFRSFCTSLSALRPCQISWLTLNGELFGKRKFSAEVSGFFFCTMVNNHCKIQIDCLSQ